MNDQRESEIFSGLPQTRPQRRSEKRPPRTPNDDAQPVPAASDQAAPVTVKPARPRASRPNAQKSTSTSAVAPADRAARAARAAKPRQRIRQPAQPAGTPKKSEGQRPRSAPAERDPVTGLVRAAAEMAEVGLAIGTHALRRALSHLPRP